MLPTAKPGTGHSRSPLERHKQWLIDLVAREPDLTLRVAPDAAAKPEEGRAGRWGGSDFDWCPHLPRTDRIACSRVFLVWRHSRRVKLTFPDAGSVKRAPSMCVALAVGG